MQRGFGLVSILLTLLIVAALSGLALEVYFQAGVGPLTRGGPAGSVRPDQSARLAEAQALLSRAMIALTLCAQQRGVMGGLAAATGAASGAGASCTLADVAASAGVGPTGLSADGRWQITVAQVSASGPQSAAVGQVSVTGVGGTATGLAASLFATPTGPVTRCDASGGAPPASPLAGQGC
jgi:hypothetical protein